MENPPKVNRTVPYRAVPCSGKAPIDALLRHQFYHRQVPGGPQTGGGISAVSPSPFL